jgi:phosphopantetheinyl transferase
VIDGVHVRVLAVPRSARRAHAWHALRCLLSEITGGCTPPDAWRFTAGERSKPRVDGPARLDANVSYGEGVVAVAASATREVGVDITPVASYAAIPASELAPRERARLDALPPAERAASAAAMWALKEAFTKCDGRGAWLPFAGVDTTSALPAGYDHATTTVDAGAGAGPHVLAVVGGRRFTDARSGAGTAPARRSARRRASR